MTSSLVKPATPTVAHLCPPRVISISACTTASAGAAARIVTPRCLTFHTSPGLALGRRSAGEHAPPGWFFDVAQNNSVSAPSTKNGSPYNASAENPPTTAPGRSTAWATARAAAGAQ